MKQQTISQYTTIKLPKLIQQQNYYNKFNITTINPAYSKKTTTTKLPPEIQPQKKQSGIQQRNHQKIEKINFLTKDTATKLPTEIQQQNYQSEKNTINMSTVFKG